MIARPGVRWPWVLAGLAGFSAVALAALGGHWVEGDDALRAWRSANQLHGWHAVALLGLAAALQVLDSRWLRWSAIGMALGLVLFSGSLYSAALGANFPAGTAPLGGVLLMLSWLGVALAGVRMGRGTP